MIPNNNYQDAAVASKVSEMLADRHSLGGCTESSSTLPKPNTVAVNECLGQCTGLTTVGNSCDVAKCCNTDAPFDVDGSMLNYIEWVTGDSVQTTTKATT